MVQEEIPSFDIERLGTARIPCPMPFLNPVKDDERMLYSSRLEEIVPYLQAGKVPPQFEMAGPREKIFFDPANLKCGIVTCGGLCPGLNDVIRAIVMSCFYHYGVRTVFGFRYGYEGLVPRYKHQVLELTPDNVERIHETGGSILSSSRGPQDVVEMVDTLERMNIGILFAAGGDGTLRGASAIAQEIRKRGRNIAVIGIPKTIDNDISYVQKSFGFETACAEARRVIAAAHTEAKGARNGVGLVKLMGRDSGFIAAYSTLATNDVNFCLVPEVPFSLQGLLEPLKERIQNRGHAVIVVAEGAGQELIDAEKVKDASGNKLHADIGAFLRDEIRLFFKQHSIELNLKYLDPSYVIRSLPANAHDAAFCLLLGQNAVHAGMSGRTNMVVSTWKGDFTHVPIAAATSQRKKIDATGLLWRTVISSTGQPPCLIESQPA